MKAYIRGLLISTGLLLSFNVASLLVTAPAVAMPLQVASLSKQAACDGLNQVDSGTASDCSNLGTNGSGVTSLVGAIVKILSIVVGIVAVIMIIISAMRFMTSGGDSGKVAAAKNALIYALIGVAVAALAQFLVHFVFNTSVHSTDACPSNPNISMSDAKCK